MDNERIGIEKWTLQRDAETLVKDKEIKQIYIKTKGRRIRRGKGIIIENKEKCWCRRERLWAISDVMKEWQGESCKGETW